MRTSLRLLLAFVIALPTPLGAQDVAPVDTASVVAEDSMVWNDGRSAGHEAADRQSMAGREVLGFVGGAATGFFLLPAVTLSPPWMLVAGSGSAVVISAGRVGSSEPPKGSADM